MASWKWKRSYLSTHATLQRATSWSKEVYKDLSLQSPETISGQFHRAQRWFRGDSWTLELSSSQGCFRYLQKEMTTRKEKVEQTFSLNIHSAMSEKTENEITTPSTSRWFTSPRFERIQIIGAWRPLRFCLNQSNFRRPPQTKPPNLQTT